MEQHVVAVFRTPATGKACGEDCIGPEPLRFAAGVLAKLFPLALLKAVARIEEPLQWRGSVLMELYKGAGDRAECATHRD
eukprot:11185069-Lingulodinium_polyedra.AAC.1